MLSLVFLLGCFYAVPYIDPIRDAYDGWRIVHTGYLPMTGPPFAGVFNLGPVWFYLMALPATWSSSMLGFSLFVGLLAVAKIPLAYRLGSELVDHAFGTRLAICMTIPTWSAFSLIFLTHAALVESVLLLTLLIMLRVTEKPATGRLALMGLTVSLGLHAHPTFIVAVLPLAAIGLNARIWKSITLSGWLAVAVGAVLPLVPALIAWRYGPGGSMENLAEFASQDLGAVTAAEIPATIYSLIVSGVQTSLGSVMSPTVANILLWGYCLTLALISVGVVVAWRTAPSGQRRFFLITVLMLIGSVIIVSVLRSRTAWYMTFVLMPFFAAVVASSMGLCNEHRWARHLTPVACVLFVVLNISWIAAYAWTVGSKGLLSVPARSMYDINNVDLEWSDPGPAVAAINSHRLGEYLCEQDKVNLLGILGTIADQRIGIDALLVCDRREQLYVGGCTADSVLSLSAPAWDILTTVPSTRYPGLGVVTADRFTCLQEDDGMPIASGDVYPFRDAYIESIEPETEHLEFKTRPDQYLVLINQFPYTNLLQDANVIADGVQRSAIWADPFSQIYHCGDCLEDVSWSVRFASHRPDLIYTLALDQH